MPWRSHIITRSSSCYRFMEAYLATEYAVTHSIEIFSEGCLCRISCNETLNTCIRPAP